MNNPFTDFMSQIPEEIMKNDEKYVGTNIALFRPKEYVTDNCVESADFHFALLSSPPPDIYINGKKQRFNRGKILTINPGESILCENAPPAEPYLSLLIKPAFIEKIAEEIGFADNITFLKSQNQYSNELLQSITNFDKETKRLDNLAMMLECLEIQITILLLREFKTNSKKATHLPDSDAYISKAIEYMHAFFSSNITIDDICGVIHVSPYHFIRIFKQKTGVSPHQYLMKVRIQKAQELLCDRQYSVAEVAIICGFLSSPHFSNTFKAITGISPSDYKKSIL